MVKRKVAMISTFVDQGVYSLASLFAVFSVSRHFSSEDFGHFMLAYAAATLCLAVSRQYFAVDLARMSNESIPLHALRFRQYWTALALSTPILILIVLASAFSLNPSGASREAIWLMFTVALSVPFWVLQDFTRYFLTERSSVALLVSDVVRLVGLVLCFIVGNSTAPATFYYIWISSHVLSCLVAIGGTKISPLTRQWKKAVSFRWGIRSSMTITGMMSALVPLLTGWMVGTAFSPTALGAWRGAAMIFGPLNTLIMFLDFGVLSKYAKFDLTWRKRFIVRLGAVMVCIALLWGLLLSFAVPDGLGAAVLGPTWAMAKPYLPIIALEYCFLCLTAVLALEFKVGGYARELTSNKFVSSLVIVTLTGFVCLVFINPIWVPAANLIGAAVGVFLACFVIMKRISREMGAA